MATILVNPDNSLSLNLSAEERVTFDGLESGQLAQFITIWLDERFKSVWKTRIEQLTTPQKLILVDYLKDVIQKP